MTSAAAKVLALPELVEQILVCLATTTIGVDVELIKTEAKEVSPEDGGDDISDEWDFDHPDDYITYFDHHQQRPHWDYGELPQPLKCLSAVRRVNYLFHHTISTSKKIQRLLSPSGAHKMRTHNPPAINWLLRKQLGFDFDIWLSGNVFGVTIFLGLAEYDPLSLYAQTDATKRNAQALNEFESKHENSSWKSFELCGHGYTVVAISANDYEVSLQMNGKVSLGRVFKVLSDAMKGSGAMHCRLQEDRNVVLDEQDESILGSS